jgi:hypothetical protein
MAHLDGQRASLPALLISRVDSGFFMATVLRPGPSRVSTPRPACAKPIIEKLLAYRPASRKRLTSDLSAAADAGGEGFEVSCLTVGIYHVAPTDRCVVLRAHRARSGWRGVTGYVLRIPGAGARPPCWARNRQVQGKPARALLIW